MKILLTGASGFIGRNLKEAWRGKYDLFAPSRRELNLLDADAVENYLRCSSFDIVIHAANTNDVTRPEDAPHALEYNLRMFCNLSRCSKYFGKMYYFGSGAEYDSAHYQDYMPEAYFGRHIPRDVYGFSKYIMSELILRYDNIYDFRLFGVFGQYEEWRRRFISNMIYQAMTGSVMRMDRHMYFDYLYIDDLIRILEWFLIHEPEYRHYNICSGQPVDLYDLALFIREEVNADAEIILSGADWKSPYTGDNSRLRLEMGELLSLTPIRDAIRALIAHYRENGFI